MKFTFFALTLLAFTSCKKDYTCDCTNTNTGNASKGDKISAGPFTKASNEEACRNNAALSAGTLKDCHLVDA